MTAESIFFVVLASLALFGAVSVVIASDPFLSALSLILNFASLGTLYLALHAPFVAVAQVIVYAGAVVVLFLFVLAYLGDRRELVRGAGNRLRWLKAGAGAVAVGLLGEIVWVATGGFDFDAFPAPADVPGAFGSPQSLGEEFLTTFVLEFEATSLVLLVAAIGGVVLGLTGRSRHSRMRELMHASSADQHRRSGVKATYGSDKPTESTPAPAAAAPVVDAGSNGKAGD